jgi:hypothetical protein
MSRLTITRQFIWFSFIIVGLVLAACQPGVVDTPVSVTTAVADLQVTGEPVTATATNETTETPPPTATAATTITLPASPTATITPSPTATNAPLPTPRPTLTREESRAIIDDWFREPPCPLPCWWDFIPGQSNWIEVNQQLDYLGLEGSSRRSRNQEGELRNVREASFDYPEDIHSSHAFTFYFDTDDILLDITQEIRGIGTEYFPLSLFLKQYGQPEEIMMSAIFGTQTGAAAFWFILGYWEKGFAILYQDIVPGEIAVHWTTVGRGCFQQTSWEDITPYNELLLWDAEKTPYRWDDMHRLMFTVVRGDPYLPLEAVTGISVAQFYETYVNTDEVACVETSIALWDPENFQWCESREQSIPVTDECPDTTP